MLHYQMEHQLPYTTFSLSTLRKPTNPLCVVCQGFPFDPITGQIPRDSDLPLTLPSPYLTQGHCIPFESDNRDWPFQNEPSTTVASGSDSKDVYKCLVKATDEFNNARLPYALLGPNSNSYLRAILDGCDIPGGDSRLPPGVVPQVAPGWSITGLADPFAKLLA